MEEEFGRQSPKTAKDITDEANVSSLAGSVTSQENGVAGGLQHLDSVLDNLTAQDTNLAEKLDSLNSLVNNLTDQDANLVNKMDHLNSLVGGLREQLNDFAQRLEHLHSVAESALRPSIEANHEKLEHLDSLAKFAERTIIEADKQAVLIKMEIAEKASAAATTIIAESKEKARVEAEKAIAEGKLKAEHQANNILREAEDKAREIRAPAEQEAARMIIVAKQQAALLERQAQNFLKVAEDKAEALENFANREASRIIAEAQQKAEAEVQRIVKDAKSKAEGSALLTRQEVEQLILQGKKMAEGELQEIFGRIHQKLLSSLEGIEETTATPMPEKKVVSEPAGPHIPTPALAEKRDKEQQPADLKEKETINGLYNGTIELAIPPPVGLDRMLQLHKHLKQTPQVEVLNLGGSVDKGITIRLSIENSVPLLKILEDLPEVKNASDEVQGAGKLVPSRQGGEDPDLKRIVVITRE